MGDQGIVQQPVDFGQAAQNAFVDRLGFAASNLARDIPSARRKVLVPAGFGLTIPERLVFQPDGCKLGDFFKTDDDVAQVRSPRRRTERAENALVDCSAAPLAAGPRGGCSGKPRLCMPTDGPGTRGTATANVWVGRPGARDGDFCGA